VKQNEFWDFHKKVNEIYLKIDYQNSIFRVEVKDNKDLLYSDNKEKSRVHISKALSEKSPDEKTIFYKDIGIRFLAYIQYIENNKIDIGQKIKGNTSILYAKAIETFGEILTLISENTLSPLVLSKDKEQKNNISFIAENNKKYHKQTINLLNINGFIDNGNNDSDGDEYWLYKPLSKLVKALIEMKQKGLIVLPDSKYSIRSFIIQYIRDKNGNPIDERSIRKQLNLQYKKTNSVNNCE